MQISLDPVRRQRVTAHLQKLFASEFDETLSEFRAQQIIDMMIRTMGPAIYNQAVQDVRAHMQGKLDDLDGEVFADGDV
jgi:uncharacterized protein (DUF2164 family)